MFLLFYISLIDNTVPPHYNSVKLLINYFRHIFILLFICILNIGLKLFKITIFFCILWPYYLNKVQSYNYYLRKLKYNILSMFDTIIKLPRFILPIIKHFPSIINIL